MPANNMPANNMPADNIPAESIYLLSVAQLYDSPNAAELQNIVLQKLDAHRLEKVQNIRTNKAKCLAMGAGLLLQLAVYNKLSKSNNKSGFHGVLEALSVSDALGRLETLETPIQISYRMGGNGKPDFAGEDWHFNLSHSGEYVCCAAAGEEIGIDIQEMKPLRSLTIAERFFSEGEYERILECGDDEERARIFYSIWVRKEAYAKLTGEGIAAVARRNLHEYEESVEWIEYPVPEGYAMALCKNK